MTTDNKVIKKGGKTPFKAKNDISPTTEGSKKKNTLETSVFRGAQKNVMNPMAAGSKKKGEVNKGVFKHKSNTISPD